MENLKSLKKTRASFKAKLTVFNDYLNALLPSSELNSIQMHELTMRHAKMSEMYNDFDSIQNDIESMTEIPDDEYAERTSFENRYFGVMAAAQDLLSRHAAPAGPASAVHDSGSVTGSGDAVFSKLQSRSKWRTQGAHPQLGEMVVVKDDRLPPNRWLLGRVTAIHPGSDGVNRVADVLTTTGTLRRAYNRLCPLPSTLDQAAPDPRGAAC
ncbi:uncharacterized protein LOC125234760 isoform X3 [Leguminivora glycinivorella]|uniref:uncharacterized protein LOC125226747 isoform X2 n=2 Tax=Leguminivora glycinivorella TaxID=1035111 RepID=UPI00200FCE28|nr:uncharacterized protein LOC125226747 isoform X2 [Leguminivora glycinivorella]XP_047997104.1 uncharacterized protein LOC125234760 isoform X3 [Leguminivora glycinivorella]